MVISPFEIIRLRYLRLYGTNTGPGWDAFLFCMDSFNTISAGSDVSLAVLKLKSCRFISLNFGPALAVKTF
jgi:hypothetical protein